MCDAYDAPGLTRAVAEAHPDQVVHLLTDLPDAINMRRFERDTASTGRLRRVGTANLIAAAAAAGVERIVAESIAFAYAPVGDWVKDEDAALAHAALPSAAEPVADLEGQVQAVGGIVLRYGWLYGPGTAYARRWIVGRALRRRLLPIVGKGGGVFSFVHVDDAAGATVAALEHAAPLYTTSSMTSPRRYASGCRRSPSAVEAPKPWHAPAWLGRLAAGRLAVEMIERAARREQRARQARAGLAAAVCELARGVRNGARLRPQSLSAAPPARPPRPAARVRRCARCRCAASRARTVRSGQPQARWRAGRL